MNDRIYLHPEHGLNPTMPQCILCGKAIGTIALLGNKYKEKAPMQMVIDIEPCDSCKESYLKVGVMMVEADMCYHGGMDEKRTPKPNGNISVIKTAAFKKLFPKQPIPTGHVVYCEPGLLSKIGALKP